MSPPPNSNVTSPSIPTSSAAPGQTSPPPQRSFTPLSDSYLSSPVPDYAATLHTQAADEADEANVNFLRESLRSLDDSTLPEDARPESHVEPRRETRRSRTQRPQFADSQSDSIRVTTDNLDDRTRRERLQRVLARLNRIHDPASSSHAAGAYSNRTPSPNRQRLYDWAPANDRLTSEDGELDRIIAELRRQQPGAHPDVLRLLGRSELDLLRRREREADSASTAPAADSIERRDRMRERRRRENEWVSLRSRAALQRVRQDGSPSATERMLRFVMERERTGISEEEERARGAGWFEPDVYNGSGSTSEQYRNRSTSRDTGSLVSSANEMRARTLHDRAEAMQRRYVADNTPPQLLRISTPPVPSISTPLHSSSHLLENALKYLDQLRTCYRYQDTLSAAIEHGLATKEFFAEKHDDFVIDLEEVNVTADSAWLQSGTVFEGHQHATAGAAALTASRPNSSSSQPEQINPNHRVQGTSIAGFDHPPGSPRPQAFDASRPWFLPQYTTPFLHTSAACTKASDASHDNWPVRVTLHTIDYERMLVQGTMEAYDVPQHPTSVSILQSADRPKAGHKHAPIITYLEGHVIDLTTNSFLTPGSAVDGKSSVLNAASLHIETPFATLPDVVSFPSATAQTDAANWRKLPPFNQLASDEDMARCLLSRTRMDDILARYVFMRWKERCFVHSRHDTCTAADRTSDQDRGHGLTISGFYYVSLRRSDGLVEGLYFDPASTPYQHLRLRGHQTGWPAFEFR